MPIELLCQGCSRKLRVGDEHAGKHARCPECGEINPIVAPGNASERPVATEFPAPPGASTFAASTGGTPFGGGASVGGTASGFDKREAASAGSPNVQWTPPASSTLGGAGAGPNPFGDRPQPGYAATASGLGYAVPHRGPMILVFGLLGFFFCLIFSILAWVMGAEDLRRMNRGEMDPSGRGLTQAGMVIGIIHCCMIGLSVVFFFLMMLIGAFAR